MQLNQRGSVGRWAQFWSQSSLVQSSLGWRRYAVVLLPLALAGLLPPWALLVMALLFGLAVDSPRWARARLVGALCIAGLLTLNLLGRWNHTDNLYVFLSVLFLDYCKMLLGIVLVHVGLLALEDGRSRGLLWLLLAGLLAPQAGLVVALLAGALLRPGRDDMLGQHPPGPQEVTQTKRSWALVGAVSLLLTAFSVVLPHTFSVTSQPAASQSTVVVSAPPRKHISTAPKSLKPFSPHKMKRAHWPSPPPELIAVTVLLGVALLVRRFLFTVSDSRTRRLQGLLFVEVLSLLAVFTNAIVLLIFNTQMSASHNREIINIHHKSAASNFGDGLLHFKAPFTLNLDVVNIFFWLLWIFCVVMLFLLWQLLSGLKNKSMVVDPVLEENTSTLAGFVMPPNRVRLAYAQAEEALTRAGYPRQPAETPTLYAARLTQLFPALADSFSPLTQLYLPVRYGSDIGETAAQQAEQAAAAAIQLAAQLPPPSKETETP